MEINLILNAGISAVLSAMLALTGYSGKTASNSGGTSEATSAETTESAADTEENNMTALEVIRAMGNGINLGNTLEAYNHQAYINGSSATSGEIVWGQPRTTQEMIQGMKAAGFDTIRIPIAWTNGMYFESGDYTIDSALMDRVDEVVTWALDADMYVIINDHWDGSWWGMFGSAEQETRDKAMEMYKAMWTQIGERFAARYALERNGQQDPVAGNVDEQPALGGPGQLRGLLRAGDGAGDGLRRLAEAVDGQMFVFCRAAARHTEDHGQPGLPEQRVHDLAAVRVGDGDDVIQFHISRPPTVR